jgi:4-hydroxy-tetrahydrodipicolinate synthase
MSVGGHGVISVAGHVIGKHIKSMVDGFATDPAAARAMHHKLMLIVKACFVAPNPVPVKYMMTKLGFDCLSTRLPLVELDDSERAVCDKALELIKSL